MQFLPPMTNTTNLPKRIDWEEPIFWKECSSCHSFLNWTHTRTNIRENNNNRPTEVENPNQRTYFYRCINCPQEREYILCPRCEQDIYPTRYRADFYGLVSYPTKRTIEEKEDKPKMKEHPQNHVFIRIDFPIQELQQRTLSK